MSFENSGCLDYVTEKFFNAFKYGLLPIALGGLSVQDYEKIAPPQSFLHVDNFASAQELMDYLVILSTDEELYNSYFWWKDFYEVSFLEANCPLCQILNTEKYRSANDYENMHEFWHQCKPALHQPVLPQLKHFFYQARRAFFSLFS